MSTDESSSEPIDLSALGPSLEPSAFDARIAAIMRASASELERRKAKPTLALVVVQWRRPVLSFVGLAAAAAAALFVMPPPASTSGASALAANAGTTASTTLSDSASVAEWLGVPSAYARMVEGASPGASRSTP